MIALALRNVFRNRMRTTLTLVVIGFGVAGLILCGGFIADALGQLRESTIHSQLGHLQIAKRDFFEKGPQSPGRYLIDEPAPLLAAARGAPGFVEAAGRLQFAGVINNGHSDFGVVGEGVEPQKERRIGSLLETMAGRDLRPDEAGGIYLGEGVAAATRLRVGDRATVVLHTPEGALNSGDFEVVGIFRSFSKDFDSRVVRITLPAAQDLLGTSSINSVVVLLDDTGRTDAAAAALTGTIDASTYEVRTWRQLADFYDKTASLYERQFTVLQAIILLAVLLSVINAVNMSVYERTAEFGTMMALGRRGDQVSRLVLVENVILGVIGSGLGVVIGVGLAALVTAVGITMPPPPNSTAGYLAAIRPEPGAVGIAFVIGAVATTVAAWRPSRRVARMSVVDALRQA